MLVNPQEMYDSADSIKAKGNELYAVLNDARTIVSNMKDNWKGEQYNNLVNIFNSLIPNLDRVISITMAEIPSKLVTIANNYLVGDGREAQRTPNFDASKIATVETGDIKVIAIEPSTVESQANQLKGKFTDALNQISSVQGSLTQNWEGEAAESFKEMLREQKASIEKDFDYISSNIGQWIKDTVGMMEAAERASTVK